MGEKPAVPAPAPLSESGGGPSSSDDLSSDAESRASEEPGLPSPQQGFRRRANTLGHLPAECPQPAEPALGSPGLSQRKLMRYHSVSTETPRERK